MTGALLIARRPRSQRMIHFYAQDAGVLHATTRRCGEAITPGTLWIDLMDMNFRAMPELDWAFGYPVALGLMAVSAILPYAWFKWKGWF
ncbi:hypothetical protein DM872_09455 [Pseudomonas taiwanensis]|nr:hypothetical protein [Pseudomonas taiwanensis]